ncbi:Rieske 2Fe-2S domain-containing protein [Acuticoccus sp. I52.16.1]|uniref:Rieske (2Fe-2S) protein n=1 Tax=Acuticoccus sp. I52.16.1 TaxID=2928472 RepID=UPI001FD528D2|nr:Rieske 2Fe-2S domain-containing protein [Acuticoccus sp. I52.16.1]UOM34033.1 Rieske 2Fe-2S domain-containing protein [Acuticoccus sp. I52.16.1]
MSEAWRQLSTAPPEGTPVAPAARITGAHGLTVRSAKGDFPLLVVRVAADLRAYVNACPHQYLPLDYRGPQILSADGARLMCTSHGAAFDAATGEGVAGPGLGCSLDPVPVHVDAAGVVRIGTG